MTWLARIVHRLSDALDRVAQAGVLLMMLLAAGNVLLRSVGRPIVGTYDYVSFAGAMVATLALARCGLQKGHIEVELFVTRLPVRVQRAIAILTGLLSLATFILVTWQLVRLAGSLRLRGELSMTSLLPFYPYVFGMAVGTALLCLVLLLELLKSCTKGARG